MLRKRARSSRAPICMRKDPNAILTAPQLEEWGACVTALLQLNNSAGVESDRTTAERRVGRAFGWGSQAFWQGHVVDVPPSRKQMESVLRYFRDHLQLKDSDIAAVVTKFPEILNVSVESRICQNLKILKYKWKLDGQRLLNVIRQQPEVLAYDHDCEGDCSGDCPRCWARF